VPGHVQGLDLMLAQEAEELLRGELPCVRPRVADRALVLERKFEGAFEPPAIVGPLEKITVHRVAHVPLSTLIESELRVSVN